MIINPLFGSTALSNVGLNKAATISEAFTLLLQTLEEICPGPGAGREFAIVRTKLEEASFYAKKSLRNFEVNRA